MKCKDIDVLLDAHRVSQLSAAAKSEVASHLEQCRRCADAWLGHEALAGETPDAPRAGFYAQAMATAVAAADADTGAVAVGGGSRRWRAAFGVAAALVITAGLVWLAMPGEERTEVAAPVVSDDSAESFSPGLLGDTLVREPEPGLSPQRLPLQAGPPAYVAGTHYARLPVPAPTTADAGQIEVCEFFMFGCIHCFAFEPALTSWVESRADSVDFVRVPVIFNDVALLHAQAYYTAEALGVVDAIVGPFYSEIHERGQMLASVDSIRKLFVSNGVDAALFDATFESAEVRDELLRAGVLNRLYGVDSTPTIGVAGKYRTDVSMAGGSNEALFEVVDALVEAELLAAASETPRCSGLDSCPSSPTPSEVFESIQEEIRRLRLEDSVLQEIRQLRPEPAGQGERF